MKRVRKVGWVAVFPVVVMMCSSLAYAGKVTELKIWTQWGGGEDKAWVNFLEEYNRTQGLIDGIHVTRDQVPDEFREQQKRAIASRLTGTGPDLFYPNGAQVPFWIRKGMVVPLPEEEQQYVRENMYPPLNPMVTWQGKIWGYPVETESMCLMYNKEHFTEAGLDPTRGPKTWEELRDYAKKLTKYEGGKKARVGFGFTEGFPEGVHLLFLTMLWGAGGEMYNADKTETYCNSEKGISVLQLLVDMVKDDSTNVRWMSWWDGFLQERISMMPISSWFNIIGVKHSGAPGLYEKCSLDLVPTPDGKNFASTSYGFALMVNVDSKHQEESFKFLKWLVKKPGCRMDRFLVKNIGVLPNQKGLKFEFPGWLPQYVEGYTKAYRISRPIPVIGPYEEIQDLVVLYITSALHEERSPKEALDYLAEVIRAIL